MKRRLTTLDLCTCDPTATMLIDWFRVYDSVGLPGRRKLT
jgi:hypothetical protein